MGIIGNPNVPIIKLADIIMANGDLTGVVTRAKINPWNAGPRLKYMIQQEPLYYLPAPTDVSKISPSYQVVNFRVPIRQLWELKGMVNKVKM